MIRVCEGLFVGFIDVSPEYTVINTIHLRDAWCLFSFHLHITFIFIDAYFKLHTHLNNAVYIIHKTGF